MKIVFLGNNYNPISIACLESILAPPKHSVTVGIHVPQGDNRLKAAIELYRSHGGLFLLRKAMTYLRSSLQLWLRRAGASCARSASLEEIALANQLPSFRFDSNAASRIADLAPDLIVVAAFSRILRTDVIDLPAKGCINVHPSLLPAYRGPTPFFWVLKNRESKTGVTIHYVDTGVDSGDIISQAEIAIAAGDDEASLKARSLAICRTLLPATIDAIARGEAKRTPQSDSDSSYYSFPPKGASLA